MTADRFKNRQEALRWLNTRGKISAGQWSNICADGYKVIDGIKAEIHVAPDKTISKFQVMEFAALYFKTSPAIEQPTPSQAARKEALEIEKLEMEVEKRKLDNRKEDDKWLQKEEAWAQMAAIIGTLRDSIRHQFHVGQSHLVQLAAGDHARAPEVYEGCEELLARAFNEVCSAGHIEVMFEQAKE